MGQEISFPSFNETERNFMERKMNMTIAVIGSVFMEYTYNIPRIPLASEVLTAKSMLSREGGRGQNQAVTMAKLDGDIKMIGTVGDDEGGEICLNSLKRYGIDTTGVAIKKGGRTGEKIIYHDDNGETNSVIYPGATRAVSTEDLPRIYELLKDVDAVLMQFEIPFEVILPVLKHCKEQNITTFVNPAPASQDFDSRYMKYIDYLIPNEIELFFTIHNELKTHKIEEACKKIDELGCHNIIVTLGSQGSVYYNGEELIKIPAESVNRRDRNCVGDSFVGTFVMEIMNGKTPVEAIKYATKAAAITLRNKGGYSALPYRKDIEN